jgi:hypothetical protein
MPSNSTVIFEGQCLTKSGAQALLVLSGLFNTASLYVAAILLYCCWRDAASLSVMKGSLQSPACALE